MTKKRKFVAIILFGVLGIGLIYIGARFYKAHKSVEELKKKLGYKTPCVKLPTDVFNRGEWKGILIDADIAYTDGAHNIVPCDLDNDGKVGLIANSYKSDALSQTCPRNELRYDRFNSQEKVSDIAI